MLDTQAIRRSYLNAANRIFLAGSVMRGEGTDTSDLDLVVVYERIDAAFRVSFIYAGWTSLVDDLRSPRSRTELIATGTALYTVLADHFLLGQGRWSASGKSIPRRLASACVGSTGICHSLR